MPSAPDTLTTTSPASSGLAGTFSGASPFSPEPPQPATNTPVTNARPRRTPSMGSLPHATDILGTTPAPFSPAFDLRRLYRLPKSQSWEGYRQDEGVQDK